MPRSRWFPLRSILYAAALVAVIPAPTRAMQAAGRPDPGALQTTAAGVSFSLGASVGLLAGTAVETVFYYPYGRKVKISELTWDLKDVVMAGVQGSVGLGRRVRLNLGAWAALNEGTGMMVDRDWYYPAVVSIFQDANDSNWTDESRHPDTSLDRGIVLDQNLSIVALQAGPFSLRGLVGFKYDSWKWSARGGTYLYSTKYYGSLDAAGSFPKGQRVITYEQEYSIPYLGIGASWTRRSFQLESDLLFGPAVFASDSDNHVLRGVLFEGDFSGGRYFALGLKAIWTFSPGWFAALGAQYQLIPEITGDVTISGAEGSGYYGGGSGVSMSATLLTLGAGYRF